MIKGVTTLFEFLISLDFMSMTVTFSAVINPSHEWNRHVRPFAHSPAACVASASYTTLITKSTHAMADTGSEGQRRRAREAQQGEEGEEGPAVRDTAGRTLGLGHSGRSCGLARSATLPPPLAAGGAAGMRAAWGWAGGREGRRRGARGARGMQNSTNDGELLQTHRFIC